MKIFVRPFVWIFVQSFVYLDYWSDKYTEYTEGHTIIHTATHIVRYIIWHLNQHAFRYIVPHRCILASKVSHSQISLHTVGQNPCKAVHSETPRVNVVFHCEQLDTNSNTVMDWIFMTVHKIKKLSQMFNPPTWQFIPNWLNWFHSRWYFELYIVGCMFSQRTS